MKRFAAAMAVVLMLCSLNALAAQNTAHLSAVTVEKFRMEIVNDGFWIVQTGAWDAQARPLYLVRSYPDGGEERVGLPQMQPGAAWRLCDAADIAADDAEKDAGGLVEYSIQCEENGGWTKLTSAWPLLEKSYNAIALQHRLWYAEGALWFGGETDRLREPLVLTVERSDGEVWTVEIPANGQDYARMLRTPAQVQEDLAGAETAWVRYSLPRR